MQFKSDTYKKEGERGAVQNQVKQLLLKACLAWVFRGLNRTRMAEGLYYVRKGTCYGEIRRKSSRVNPKLSYRGYSLIKESYILALPKGFPLLPPCPPSSPYLPDDVSADRQTQNGSIRNLTRG